MEELSFQMKNQVKKLFKTYVFKKVDGEEVKSKCYEIVTSAQKVIRYMPMLYQMGLGQK